MIPYFVIDQIVLGPVKLYTWGLFVGLGFSAGYLLFYYLARRENLAPTKIAGLSLAIFVGAILGAKILAVATLSGANWQAIFSAQSGAAFMGGLLGAIVYGWGYVKLVKLDFWQIADLLVLPTALGISLGRIGCALINDHQGAITNLSWGILWPDGIARQPVGIYEALAGFGLLVVFWFIKKRLLPERSAERSRGAESKANPSTHFVRSGNNGFLFLTFLVSYSIIRFFLDFTRVASGPLADPRWGALSVSQWLALGIIFIVGFYWVFWGKATNY